MRSGVSMYNGMIISELDCALSESAPKQWEGLKTELYKIGIFPLTYDVCFKMNPEDPNKNKEDGEVPASVNCQEIMRQMMAFFQQQQSLPVNNPQFQFGPGMRMPFFPTMNFGNMVPPETSSPQSAAPPKKRGRPPTKREKKHDSSDDEFMPSPGCSGLRSKKKKDQDSRPASPTDDLLPKRDKNDVDFSENSRSNCSACQFFRARYIVDPCYHFGFCISCLTEEHNAAAEESRKPKCIACGVQVKRYMQGYKCTIRDLPDPEDD